MKFLMLFSLIISFAAKGEGDPNNFYKLLRGKLGDDRIVMNLIKVSGQLRGNYYSQSTGMRYIAPSSTIADAGNFEIIEAIEEYDENYEPVIKGVMKGRIVNGKVTGEYRNLKVGEVRKLDLEEDYSSGSIKIDYNHYYRALDSSATIEIAFPLLQNDKPEAKNINKVIMDIVFGEERPEVVNVEELMEEYIKNYQETAKELKGNEETADFNIVYYNSATGEIELNEERILSLSFLTSTFEGGAHPSTFIAYKSFNLDTGEEVTLSELFKGNYMEILNKEGEKQLRAEYNVPTESSLEEEGFWFENGFELNNNFVLLQEGIKFLFNQYEIAAYVFGAPEVFIRYDSIEEIIKKDGLLESLRKK